MATLVWTGVAVCTKSEQTPIHECSLLSASPCTASSARCLSIYKNFTPYNLRHVIPWQLLNEPKRGIIVTITHWITIARWSWAICLHRKSLRNQTEIRIEQLSSTPSLVSNSCPAFGRTKTRDWRNNSVCYTFSNHLIVEVTTFPNGLATIEERSAAQT